jgi:hypothetical protein
MKRRSFIVGGIPNASLLAFRIVSVKIRRIALPQFDDDINIFVPRLMKAGDQAKMALCIIVNGSNKVTP